MDESFPIPEDEKSRETGWAFADLSKEKETTQGIPEEKEKLILKILYAEDDPGVAAVTEIILKRKGHAVVMVDNVEALLNALKNGEYDLIITDNNLKSKITGVQALKEIRQINNKVPILVYSGLLTEDEKMEVGKNNAEFLSKSGATMQDIYGAMERAIEKPQ